MIRVLVDSSSDYMQAEAQKNNLEFVPLTVMINDVTYKSGVELTHDEFYEKLIDGKEFPKTAQPSPQDFLTIFEDAKEKGDDVICILLSSALSGTCQSAHLAKNMADYDNIYIIDSLSAIAGMRIMAEYAVKLSSEGMPASEIAEKIEAIKSKVKIIAGVDTLEYLCRGGRLSRTAATIGELANLKPILTVKPEGVLEVLGKTLGRVKAINYILNQLENSTVDTEFPMYSVYTYGTENVEKLENKLSKEGYRIDNRCQIGASIGAHVGPGAFGVVFVEK